MKKRNRRSRRRANRIAWDKSRFRHVSTFLEQVEHAIHGLDWAEAEDPFPLFRGVRDGTWKLIPTLHREFIANNVPADRHREIESDLFFEFEARASEQLRGFPSDWDVLFLMRHYGVPTRLLDWTESLLMAAYFALQFNGSTPSFAAGRAPRIWILNPYALNAKRSGWGYRDLVAPRFLRNLSRRTRNFSYSRYLGYRSPKSWPRQRPITLYPQHTNVRLRAQRGYFTLHGSDNAPVDEQLTLGPEIAFVDIEQNMYEPLLDLLDHAGLTHFLMHQSLEGLSQDLHATYLQAAPRLAKQAARRAIAGSRSGSRKRTASDRRYKKIG